MSPLAILTVDFISDFTLDFILNLILDFSVDFSPDFVLNFVLNFISDLISGFSQELSSRTPLGLGENKESKEATQRQFEERAPRETDELLTHALEEIGDGFVAVLPEAFFNRTTLARLSDTGLLGGVLVLEEDRDSGDGDGDGGGGGSGSTLAGVAVVGGEGGAVGSSNPDVSTPQVGRMFVFPTVCFGRGRTVFNTNLLMI